MVELKIEKERLEKEFVKLDEEKKILMQRIKQIEIEQFKLSGEHRLIEKLSKKEPKEMKK